MWRMKDKARSLACFSRNSPRFEQIYLHSPHSSSFMPSDQGTNDLSFAEQSHENWPTWDQCKRAISKFCDRNVQQVPADGLWSTRSTEVRKSAFHHGPRVLTGAPKEIHPSQLSLFLLSRHFITHSLSPFYCLYIHHHTIHLGVHVYYIHWPGSQKTYAQHGQ